MLLRLSSQADLRSIICFGCVEPGADLLGMFLLVVVGIARDECKEGAAFWPGKAIGIVQIFFRKDLDRVEQVSFVHL